MRIAAVLLLLKVIMKSKRRARILKVAAQKTKERNVSLASNLQQIIKNRVAAAARIAQYAVSKSLRHLSSERVTKRSDFQRTQKMAAAVIARPFSKSRLLLSMGILMAVDSLVRPALHLLTAQVTKLTGRIKISSPIYPLDLSTIQETSAARVHKLLYRLPCSLQTLHRH